MIGKIRKNKWLAGLSGDSPLPIPGRSRSFRRRKKYGGRYERNKKS